MEMSKALSPALKALDFPLPTTLTSKVKIGFFLTLPLFLIALFVDPYRTAQGYLVAFLFFFAISIGGVVWATIMRVVYAHWGRPLLHLWESFGLFLLVVPVLYLLLVVLSLFTPLYPWVHHPIPHKEGWLSPLFVFLRGGVEIGILCGLGLYILYHSYRMDIPYLSPNTFSFLRRFYPHLTEEDSKNSYQRLIRISPIYLLLYALLMTLFAFDFLMSLEPHWYSTLFGGFIFSQNLFMAMAFTALSIGVVKKVGTLDTFFGRRQFWDVGGLLFAFSMFWTYLMWSQYLPIWYGNMPEETGFLIKRTTGPYRSWAFFILAITWTIPWIVLLFRKNKWRPVTLGLSGFSVLLGTYGVLWTIVVPSRFPTAPVPYESAIFPGWIELFTFLPIFFLFLWTFTFSLRNLPILPVGDPIFQKQKTEEHH